MHSCCVRRRRAARVLLQKYSIEPHRPALCGFKFVDAYRDLLPTDVLHGDALGLMRHIWNALFANIKIKFGRQVRTRPHAACGPPQLNCE